MRNAQSESGRWSLYSELRATFLRLGCDANLAADMALAAAFAIARAARSAGTGITADSTLKITFCPPDRRRRDLDNCLASIKAHLDGIADAFGVDDSGWRLRIERGAPVKCGCVRVEVS